MFLILRLFNSFLFVFGNVSVVAWTLHRFYRAMKLHHQLVDDVQEYSNLVNQSRASLQYVGVKVSEAMKDMEADIEREVHITHNLTKLAPKISSVTKRFANLEDGIIELARLERNMENATVGTPVDINEEVVRILRAMKGQSTAQQPSQIAGASEPSPGTLSERSRASSANKPSRRPFSPAIKCNNSIAPAVRSVVQTRHATRPRSPEVVPEVSLLAEGYVPTAKPIGFRPPWMCQV